MKMRMTFGILLISLIIISACEDPVAPTQDAVLLTKTELEATFGYEWFSQELEDYTPKDSLINIIDSVFDANIHQFIIFMQPECSCVAVVKNSAHLVKILETSKIAAENFMLFSMGNENSKHPYRSVLALNILPSAFLFKNDSVVYSILDTFYYYQDRAEPRTIEEITADALSNY